MAAMDAGADVVFGQRTSREAETWFKRTTASLFYRLLAQLATEPIPRDTGDFRLMSRRVVDVLAAMPERQRFIRGMVCWVGGRQVALPYERHARHAGTSKYPLRKMARFALDAITSFSTIPLRLASYLGIAATALASLLLLFTLWRWLTGATVVGWASLMTAIVLFSAVQLIVLGIMGEYIGRLLQETKARPLFLVDTVLAGQQRHALPMDFHAGSRRAPRCLGCHPHCRAGARLLCCSSRSCATRSPTTGTSIVIPYQTTAASSGPRISDSGVATVYLSRASHN
jgi:hypothetical protein